MGFVGHTSAFTAHRMTIQGKLWFLRNSNSNMRGVYIDGFGVGYLTGLSFPSAEFRELATWWGLQKKGASLRPHTPLCRENSGCRETWVLI